MHAFVRRGAAPALAFLLALAAPAASAAPPGSPWGEGYFPDVELVTQEGRRVRFYSDLLRDRQVVVTFLYTRCTQTCGLTTANLARVQRELGERIGRDIHFYSVSLEPEHDTPERLRAYAAAFKARPGWTFLTGRAEDVALLRKKFGDLAPVEEHAPVIDIGNDATGQWRRTSALDNPRYLATVISGFLDPAWGGGGLAKARGYEAAPAVAAPGKGQKLYRDRCAACHVDGGDSVGPDLRGVTDRRDPAWLTRWIRSPGELIDAKDPLALRLLAEHGGVAMPPSGLTEVEVAAIVEFLRARDRRAGPLPGAGAAAALGPGGGR